MAAASGLKPINEEQQVWGKCAETSQFFVLLAILCIPDQTSYHKSFVDIESTTALVEYLHR
jgi:hypothetical protein